MMWRDISHEGHRVRWMREPEAPHAVAELCERAGLTPESFPSAARISSLRQKCSDIIVGVFSLNADGSERDLVGAAVILPISPDVASKFSDGRLTSGKTIGPHDLRRSWRSGPRGNDVYVSVLVADDSHAASVMRLASLVLDRLQGSGSAFTRAAAKRGQLACRRLGFTPIPASVNHIWVKDGAADSTGWRRAPRTLAAYDRWLRVHSAVIRIMRPTFYVLYGCSVIALAVMLSIPGPISRELMTIFSLEPAQIAPVMATSATLGGLALTVFFLTAQLKMSGISQYGMTAIYRVRDITPLIALTGVTVLLGIVVLVLRHVAASGLIAFAAGAAVLSNAFLIALIVLLSVELIRNLDPVAVARRFARNLRGQNADEWGLVEVHYSDSAVSAIEVRSNRTNFGLRDPLMPIHEIHLTAVPQRYGQILGVLAEQVARAYGCRWQQQFPDAGAWRTGRSRKLADRFGDRVRALTVKTGRSAEKDRLQLAMLILHYVKRVHLNDKLLVPADYRRQAALFVMSRLIVVLASGIPAGRVSRVEATILLRRCVDVVLRVGSDYALTPVPGRLSKHRPRVDNELFRAFPAAIRALAENGYPDLAEDAAQTARWLINSGSIERRRLGNFAETLTRHPRLVRIVSDEVDMRLPDLVRDSPWGAAVPSPSPTSSTESPPVAPLTDAMATALVEALTRLAPKDRVET